MSKVSVIIPVYNVEKYLSKALDSVCEQTLKDIQIICIDDCSTDNSVKIIKEYMGRDSRIELIKTESNRGQGNARNIGLKQVNGEYIMFLDPDDWFAENACELAYNQIKANDNDVVKFNYYIYYEKNKKIKYRDMTKNFKEILDKNNIKLADLKNFKIPGGSVWDNIYKAEFIRENNVKFGEGHCGEDNVFYIKAMLLSNTISLLKEPLYYYRKREDKTSCTDTDLFCFEGLNAKRECYSLTKNITEKNRYNLGLIYCINSIIYIFNANNKKIRNFKIKTKFYNEVRDLLFTINAESNSVKACKSQIKYREFIRFIKYNFYEYSFLKFVDNIFSIYQEEGKLKMNILWVKFVFRL